MNGDIRVEQVLQLQGQPLVVDVHTHLAPCLSEDVFQAAGADPAAVAAYGLNERVGPPLLNEPRALVGWLAANKIDRAVASIPPPYYRQDLPDELTGQWAQVLNKGLAKAVAGQDSLHAFAYLPLHSPAQALAEYDRVTDDSRPHQWAGWTAAAGAATRLDEPALEPLWRRADDDEAVVLLHPGESPDERFSRYYLANLLGNPIESGLAAAQLILGGVLERYPKIRFVLVHCGGVVPSVIARWQRGFDTSRPGVDPGGLPPLQAVRGLWFDTLTHSATALTAAADVVGLDHLVLGSDWPFPMGLDDPTVAIAHLTEEDRMSITRANPARLLERGRR